MSVKPNQIEKLLQELLKITNKLEDTKAVLKHYRVKSERLTDLMKAKKELAEQIADEKDRIENEFYEDKDYETAKNDQLTLKNQTREKASELRHVMAQVDKDQLVSTYDYNIAGEKIKMQVERGVKVYLNGREQK